MTSFVQDKQLTIDLQGEIDHHRAKQIMEDIREKVDNYLPNRCILDFQEVSFMDSSGIAIVIHALRHMNQLGGKLTLRNIPAQPMKVLKAAGIQKLTAIQERTTP
ncbi:MAG: STAS domain-containing protein [Eubacteriales bacterium]